MAILKRIIFPQGFMLPGFKMCLVKLKGDEKTQEEHQNVSCKNIPPEYTGARVSNA